MTGLYIAAGIIVVILILLLVPTSLKIDYDGDVKAEARYLFLRFRLYPRPKKKEKPGKKKKDEQEDGDNKQGKKKENAVIRFTKEHGIEGLIELLKDIVHLVTVALKGFAKYLVIDYLVVNAVVVGDDSADTAIQYGYVCSAVYPLISIIDSNVRLKKHSEDISAGFLAEKTEVELRTKMSMCTLCLLAILIAALIRLVKALAKAQKV